MEEKKESTRDELGRFIPGKSGNPQGPYAGVKHKASVIKEAFFDCFERIGGIAELVNWVNKSKMNRKEFYRMLLTILPKETLLEGKLSTGETKIVIVRAQKEETPQLPDQTSSTQQPGRKIVIKDGN
jgi:hypothetical protein